MDPISLSVDEGFDRLQRRLLAMRVGDNMRPGDVACETGLSTDVCRSVLLGLERAGLMTRPEADDQDYFVRRRLDLTR